MSEQNCGCPQTSPSTLSCPASLNIPIDQLLCPVSSPCPTVGGSPTVSFHQSISGFVVPAVGGQSSMSVANGLHFVPGQWIQFVYPAGTFKIQSITGNVLTLINAAADGTTAIAGNPIPPYQYPANAAFVTVDQPVQLTQEEYDVIVQTAIANLQSICVDSIPDQGVTEQIWLLGYLKTSLCGEGEGACLRKQDVAYIDEDGVLHFDGTIVAEAFSVPVPEGGLVASNSTSLNPNSGSEDGFLLPFYNPLTGTVTYIDLFSGAANGQSYFVSLSPTGQISLTKGDSLKNYYPDKQVHYGDGLNYAGYASQLVDIATIIGEALPIWATHVKIDIDVHANVTNDSGIGVKLNDQFALQMALQIGKEHRFFKSVIVPITGGKFKLEIIVYSDLDATVVATSSAEYPDFHGSGADSGHIRISISQLLRSL